MKRRLSALLACVLAGTLLACSPAANQQADTATDSAQASTATTQASSGQDSAAASLSSPASLADALPDKYQLERLVILSRHNIRSPMAAEGSVLSTYTPYEWFNWSSAPRELSLRGGLAETSMGQYFRKWLSAEGLIEENWVPGEGQARFYSNTKQRTIATAQYFSSGMLPTANVTIEHQEDLTKMDPVFFPGFTYMSDAYAQAILQQANEWGGDSGIAGITSLVSDELVLMEQVIDFKNSEAYKSGEATSLNGDDTTFLLEANEEPRVKGSLNTVNTLSDALVLQYYEQPDDKLAGFGTELSFEQWDDLATPKDLYASTLFTLPLVSPAIAHPLLQELRGELTQEGRVFSFLCGHDSNIASVLAALGVDVYELPGTIEDQPIGAKLTFEVWKDDQGVRYVKPVLIYERADQLRSLAMLDLDNPPVAYELSFGGVQANEDGLYTLDNLLARFDEAIGAYDSIAQEYGVYDEELAEAA